MERGLGGEVTKPIASILALTGICFVGCQRKDSDTRSVKTLNSNYDRTSSRVLVREVAAPTRALLDYAAYSANVMLWDAPADTLRWPQVTAEDLRFGGFLGPPGPKPEGHAVETPLHFKQI